MSGDSYIIFFDPSKGLVRRFWKESEVSEMINPNITLTEAMDYRARIGKSDINAMTAVDRLSRNLSERIQYGKDFYPSLA